MLPYLYIVSGKRNHGCSASSAQRPWWSACRWARWRQFCKRRCPISQSRMLLATRHWAIDSAGSRASTCSGVWKALTSLFHGGAFFQAFNARSSQSSPLATSTSNDVSSLRQPCVLLLVSKTVAFAIGRQAMPLPRSTSEWGRCNRHIEMRKFGNLFRYGEEPCRWQLTVIS